MNYSKFRITLDIHKHQSQVSIPVMTGDTAVQILVTLTDGGLPYVIGKSCWAQFVAIKPDVSEPLLRKCIIEDGTTIRLDFDEGITDVAGVYDCEIRLYGAEGKLTSPRFTMVSDPRVAGDHVGDDMAANGFIDQIGETMAAFQRAEEARVAAEEGRADAVDAIKDLESAITAAEVERADAEEARNIAEAIRASREEERVALLQNIAKPTSDDEGKYLQIINGKVAFSEQPYISPKLFPPMVSSVTEWGKISISNNSMNGGYKVAFKIYVNGKHVDTTITAGSAEWYFNQYVDGKYTGVVGVSAVADGFLESEVTNRDYALTTGTYGLSYSVNGSSAVCTGIGSAFAQDIEIGTYYRGVPVREIAASAFEGADISSVKIPESVETIRDCAFQKCASLVSVEFAENGKNVHYLGGKAFNQCTDLATFKIPTGLKGLKFGTLVGNDVITSLTIPANIEYMYNQCIYALTALETVRFNGGPTGTNGAANFSKCPNLTDIYVPWNYIENGYFGAPWGAENATVHYGTPTIIDPQTI